MILTENELDSWVRGHARDAQGLIVELVERLVSASSPGAKLRRFPRGDSIGQPGPDGELDTDFPLRPFIPEGKSFWEIGTGEKPGGKATTDYDGLTTDAGTAIPEETRQNSAFIFVTPLSGSRSWNRNAQRKWLDHRMHRGEWKEISVIDGTGLIAWLGHFPGVERWLGHAMGVPMHEIESPELRWAELRTIGEPPPLTPQVFLANREAACKRLKEVLSMRVLQLQLDTHFPDQMVPFVCAAIATMANGALFEAVGRCLIVSSAEAWNSVVRLPQKHVLVADFDLDEDDAAGTLLIERARRAGHPMIFAGPPGGKPHPNRIGIPSPKAHQVKEALEKAGYPEQRARVLAQRSDGNLGSLLRCLQNLSLMPEWAERTHAAELAIAALLGSWSEASTADRSVAEGLSGKAYGEWIRGLREVALRPGTPLTQREGAWKFVARYEGWYATGQWLFDEHLDRLREAAARVLREKDPRFDLAPDERYAAGLHGKVLSHSRLLRNGLAEALALVGCHPKALTSCSLGKAEATAVLAVRDILTDADWVLWSSLNDLLPLLAEAAPAEFMNAVEQSLNRDPCPFDTVFAQEGAGITGRNYLTGLLWALETLAWDAAHLTRALILLGELAARDPGGNWANRPENSLGTILLPWFPQTCAHVSKRIAAVEALMKECPDVAWKVLLNLLPSSHGSSFGSRRPAWRETIPDDWSAQVKRGEYWEQITTYARLAVDVAKSNRAKLSDLIERLHDLPQPAHEQVVAHLGSAEVASLPEVDRLPLWMALIDEVVRHRKFADAQWAMPSEKIDKMAAVAELLAPREPALLHRRLFSERDFELYEETGSYDLQARELEDRRQRAVQEVLAAGGIPALLQFAVDVESSWRVGVASGVVADDDLDTAVLPELMGTQTKSLAQFAGGFVRARYFTHGWKWVDAVRRPNWAPEQTGQFLAYLPFVPETWQRATALLEGDESPYWKATGANAFEADSGLELAIDRLIQYGRPRAALRCVHKMLHDKKAPDASQAVRVLLAAVQSTETAHGMDAYEMVEVIKALQTDPNTRPDQLFQVEWAYLPLLDGHSGATPKVLERRLAEDPGFFCEVVRLVFRSKEEKEIAEEPTPQQQSVATNGYRLLHGWRVPPGSVKDSAYDGKALTAWLAQVREACTASGHLEIALTMAGHVLAYTPPDPDGLWIHRSAAAALNAKQADDMRDGFRTELYNSRGVHSVDPTGKEEHALAERYRSQADDIEKNGYHRLAGSLRQLAADYDREGEQNAAEELGE